jgi:hypothetical protein
MSSIRSVAVAALIVVLGSVTAFAASISFGGGSLGMASTSTPRCTNAGLGLIQNLAGSNVISVTVNNLPSACGNATLQVTLNNLTASSGGSASVPAAGGSVTVTLAAAVAMSTTEEIDLVLTGP